MSVFRFAPSPNGELHLGHAYSALLNARLAQQCGGRLLLRIEDIDTARCTPAFEAQIYDDLAWLGIAWERPVRRQFEHFSEYAAALERLRTLGLVYPAFMSRGEVRAWITDHERGGTVWPRDPDSAVLYPPVDKYLSDTERQVRMASGLPFAWRLDMDRAVETATGKLPLPSLDQRLSHSSEDKTRYEAVLGWSEFDPADNSVAHIDADPASWGDVILARSDTPTSYHLSVVLDDALQGVTHVVRGKDLYAATGVHRLLQTLLELPQPLYHHHRLILDQDGRKLSKSERSSGLRAMREAGATPQDIRRMVGLIS